MADSVWFYARGGHQHGPVSVDDVRGKLASGELTSQDLVWREGLGDWKPASEVVDFAAYGRPPQTAPPAYRGPGAGPQIPYPRPLQYGGYATGNSANAWIWWNVGLSAVAYVFIIFLTVAAES